MFLVIAIVAFSVIGWLSYYTSSSVYKSLAKQNSRYARLAQVLVGLGMFALLTAITIFIVLYNIRFER